MEENEPKDVRTSEPTGAPVVDIQPPKDETDTPSTQPDLSDPLGDEGSDAVSTETAAEPQPETPKPDDAAGDKPPTDNPTTETGAPNPVERPELPAPKHHHRPVLMIIIAILVAAILAIVAIMAFTKKDDKSANQNPVTPQAQTPVEEPSVETQVGEVTGAIDDALANVDETKDFPDNEISDGTLGL